MSTVNVRIAAVVAHSGLTKTAFAQRLRVSQGFVSELCSGKSKPSERTLKDICEEFDINEAWLRTGDGDMLRAFSRREEIERYLGQILGGRRSPVEEAFISAMARLPSEYWPIISRAVDAFCTEYLSAANKKEDRD